MYLHKEKNSTGKLINEDKYFISLFLNLSKITICLGSNKNILGIHNMWLNEMNDAMLQGTCEVVLCYFKTDLKIVKIYIAKSKSTAKSTI